MALLCAKAAADTNYDESKAGTYALPDPLVLRDGTPVRDSIAWFDRRRPEILELYRNFIYGRSPPRPDKMAFRVFDQDRRALGGKAIRKQITIDFFGEEGGPKMDVLLYLPADSAEPSPVFLALAFSGNDRIWPDPSIKLAEIWNKNTKTKQTDTVDQRGRSARSWPVDRILERGYGLAVMYYCDIEPDFIGGLSQGVRAHYLKPGRTELAPDEWGAIGAWAWGMSRALDYLFTDPDVDGKRVIALGQSRLGKTTLWAGAQDTRFAMVIAANSGEMGAKISRRNYGETVDDMIEHFPYQFCANFRKFKGRWGDQPVDGHMLLSLTAPRPIYLATGSRDQWSDPRGEFLAAVAAEPVFRLLGREGLGTTEMPPLDTAIMHTVGFSCHTGKHEITQDDWDRFLDFADLNLKK